MGLKIEISNATLLARLACEIDHHSAERLRVQIDSAFDKSSCKHIVLDFSDVSFMDSSGIGMIIGRYKNTEKRGGRLTIAGMNNDMARIYNISGLAKIINRADTIEEAMQSVISGGNQQ